MHSRFDAFRASPLGRQLEALIDTRDRYLEYAALSRAGMPAVAALVHELQAHYPEVGEDQTARQFCGAAVAEVMRRHYHDILRPRGRIPGGFLTYGAVWTPLPRRPGFAELLAAMRAMPDEALAIVSAIPAGQWRTPPAGTGFSVVEHLCHLRDLDAVHAQRIRRLLSEALPVIEPVDGVRMARERQYGAQDPQQAAADWRRARQALVELLEQTREEERARLCLFGGLRRMSLGELVEEMHGHDRTHLQELDELAADLAGLDGQGQGQGERA